MAMPTLVLWADSDPALGVGLLRGIEEVVERPEVHVLENCSHWIQQDKCAAALRPKLHSMDQPACLDFHACL